MSPHLPWPVSQCAHWRGGTGTVPAGRGGWAFTLIEIMVVVAIIGIVMTMAVPSLYRQIHPESMQKAVDDIQEACTQARARAILEGVPTELVIRPGDRQIQVMTVSARSSEPESPGGGSGSESGFGRESMGGGASVFSAHLSDRIVIDLLDVNFLEFKDEEEARVRFYPNGTSDEFTIVMRSDKNEWRKISLEPVTGLSDFETDPNKVRDELNRSR